MTYLNNSAPLVSVVVPAQSARHLAEALSSVSMQSYRPLELLIADDDSSGEVAAVVENFRFQADFPIRHLQVGLGRSMFDALDSCVEGASGEYIKFLNDTDVLEPDCVESLVSVMESEDVVLASSRRIRIDEDGAPLPDIEATVTLFADDVLINGRELVSFFADNPLNFIGELSATMCRRTLLLNFLHEMPALNGRVMHGWGDLALYAKLLRLGNLALLAKPLLKYRVLQASTKGSSDLPVTRDTFGQMIKALGWRRAFGENDQVQVAPITRLRGRVYKATDLKKTVRRATTLGLMPWPWLEARRPSDTQRALIEQRLAQNGNGPLIAIFILDVAGDRDAVERTLASLNETSLYRNTQATVVAGPAFQLGDRGGAITAAMMNELGLHIQVSAADWLLIVEAGVEFTVSGLLIVALDLLEAPSSCIAVFADEMVRLEDGELGHALRPDFNLDFLLSFPAAMSRHWLYRCRELQTAGGFNREIEQAFELEYQLRLVAERGIGCIGHVSEPLLICDAPLLQDSPTERQVIEQHLMARGYAAPSVISRFAGRYDVDYGHHVAPTVSIVIVIGKDLPRIQRCVQSILEKTSYGAYEVLLLVREDEQTVVGEWLLGVEKIASERIRVLRFSAQFSAAQLRNQAAAQAQGDFLLYLGAGAAVMHADWLQQLLNHGLRPEVGAVGGKLLRADGKVRNGGSLLGFNGPVGHALEEAPLDAAGYMSRLLVDQNHSALSADCLLLRKALLLEAGGFDEEPEFARWADADLCLRLQQAGFLNVWTPRVQLLMDIESCDPVSDAEEGAMFERWLPLLARDPAHNPAFSLAQGQGFALAETGLSWRPLESWRPLPVVLGFPADPYGCGHYRVIQPFNGLRDGGVIDGTLLPNTLDVPSLERFQPDVVLVQRVVLEHRLESLKKLKQFSSAFKVYELDDYVMGVPLKSIHRKDYQPNAMSGILRRGLSCVDRFVVSTEPLAEALGHLHSDIRVVKNCLDPKWWGALSSERRVGRKPRVGWAGGSSHTGDLEMISEVVKELAGEVEWVFFGMCPEKLRPYVDEFHPGVPIDKYSAALAALNLDLALAPVEQNLFNECKSNLRILEYGACGFPVIASDVACYRGDLPVTLVKNRYLDWVNAIRMHVNDLDASHKLADELRTRVSSEYMLEGMNLQRWREAWLPS